MKRLAAFTLVATLTFSAQASDYKAFGRLLVTNALGETRHCDATVVGKKHIMTSATCFNGAYQEGELVEFIAGYKGSLEANPKRYVISKAWIPKSFDRAAQRGSEIGKVQANFALLEAHSPETKKWVGEEVPRFTIADRYDHDELENLEDNEIHIISFQNRSNNNQIEIKSCEADFADMVDGSVHNTSCNYFQKAIGSPVLEKIGPYFAITAILSGSRRNTGNSVITRFGRFINPIKDVINGRSQTEFEPMDITWGSTYSVQIKNGCHDRDIQVHVVYQDYFSGDMKKELTRRIKPGDVSSLHLRARGTKIFFRGESNGKTWGSGDAYYQVNGSSKAFTQMNLDTDSQGKPKYNDEKISLTCS